MHWRFTGGEAAVEADHGQAPVRLGGFGHLPRLIAGSAERLLREDVLARLEAGQDDREQHGRRGDAVDGIKLDLREHFVKVGEASFDPPPFRGKGKLLAVEVADSGDLREVAQFGHARVMRLVGTRPATYEPNAKSGQSHAPPRTLP
jgi:hypothetical protein